MRTHLRDRVWLGSILAAYLGLAANVWAGDPELYAVTQSGYFGVLDPLTGSFSTIGETNTLATANIAGLGVAANSGLYGFGAIQSSGLSQLYVINTNTGIATAVGPAGNGIGYTWGMTATPKGDLYAYLSPNYYGTTLYKVNPTNGMQTAIGELGGHFAGGFASDASGNLFITVGNGAPDELYSVNPAAGAATLIGLIGSDSAPAIAFYGNTLYLTDFSSGVWTVNTTTGAGTQITNYNSQTYNFIYALASQYPTAQPAPVIQAIAAANGAITLSWSTVAGFSYQLQYSPDLAPGNWIDLGASVTATGSTLSAGDLVGADSQRFYRVALSP